jgi:hypothetical protein
MFLVSTGVYEALFSLKQSCKSVKYSQNLLFAVAHPYLSGNVTLLDGRFMQIVVVKKSAECQIFNQRKMMCVRFVIANMKLVKVHSHAPNVHPEKKPRQEGWVLFSARGSILA